MIWKIYEKMNLFLFILLLKIGVLIVGYGVAEYPKFNKTLPYWIVKNRYVWNEIVKLQQIFIFWFNSNSLIPFNFLILLTVLNIKLYYKHPSSSWGPRWGEQGNFYSWKWISESQKQEIHVIELLQNWKLINVYNSFFVISVLC